MFSSNLKNFQNSFKDFMLSEVKSSDKSEKIIPKDLVHLKQLVRDNNIRLDKIIIPKNITSLSYLFHNEPRTDFSGLETWDVSHITDMYQVFFKCEHFTGKGLEKWDVSNVKNMVNMFYGCKNFTGKAIENWNVGKVTEMGAIFSNCDKFNADLSKWKVHNVKNMVNMFYGCKSFSGKGLENWDTKKLENIQAMFYGCKSFSGKSIEKWDLRKIQDISFKSDLETVFEGSGVKNYPENFIKRFSFPEYKAPPKKTRESEFKRKFGIDYSKAPKRVQELWDQYDIYTAYIDDLKEQQKAERENDYLEKQIREILNK